ncbi:MAG: MBL fold metallo-hydrolase RNA specificity domain-containing protein [Chakrabartia sp.]
MASATAETGLSLRFHGAAKTVTGSCLEFRHGAKVLLVDCGLFQGSRSLEALNHGPFDFDAAKVAAVVLTHAHIDHSGLLPKLMAQGFKGKIFCTGPTADLLEHMLADAGRIQESEAARRNRRHDRAGDDPFKPLYTEADALDAWRACQPIDEEDWFEPAPGFRARFWNAGHILGAASVELEVAGTRVLCSGDLGPDNKTFEALPIAPQGFDHVICESTYGDRARPPLTPEARRAALQVEVRRALARGGNLIIPAFALERTQELLFDLGLLMTAGELPNVPIFVDSPLANKTTRVFAAHAEHLEDTGGANVFAHPAFHFVDDVTESMRLNALSGAIILAASGMCEAGRIRHHLLHNLDRPDSSVLFVGFQAQGSLGRVLVDGAKTVRISGRDVRVRAEIRVLDGYSAHADQTELRRWIEARLPISGSLFLDHGEQGALEALKALIAGDQPGLDIRLPEIGEVYALSPAAPARRTATGDPSLAQSVARDWQNAYADFATRLKRELAEISDARDRQHAIDDMRRVLESYKAHKARRARRHPKG